jgi:phosphoribosylaminoimidazole-succinocarboxamide synthase
VGTPAPAAPALRGNLNPGSAGAEARRPERSRGASEFAMRTNNRRGAGFGIVDRHLIIVDGGEPAVFPAMTYQDIAAHLPREAVTRIADLPFPRIGSGKVREIFDLRDRLLLVASDRISAFDVVLPDGVPGKGAILTQMSHFWFGLTKGIVDDHLVPEQERVLRDELKLSRDLQLRSMVVRKLKPLAMECVARGYLAGSGWSSYKKNGTVCGHVLPPGLQEAQQLPQAIFTPTTKAHTGHDEPLTEAQARALVGDTLFEQVRSLTLEIYALGHARAKKAGVILADTKFEFGHDANGGLYLIDEVLTPDSSRFWEASTWKPGGSPASFDKQFVRDYLLTLDWNQKPPGPRLPAEVIAGTQARYLEALRRLMEA